MVLSLSLGMGGELLALNYFELILHYIMTDSGSKYNDFYMDLYRGVLWLLWNMTSSFWVFSVSLTSRERK